MATNWRKKQLQLENAYAQAMLHEDGIDNTSTVHVNLNYQQVNY
jgi:hypothetical protein